MSSWTEGKNFTEQMYTAYKELPQYIYIYCYDNTSIYLFALFLFYFTTSKLIISRHVLLLCYACKRMHALTVNNYASVTGVYIKQKT